MGLKNWLIGQLTKEREQKAKEQNEYLASLPQEVRLLKDLPGVKAGLTLALTDDGIYLHNGKTMVAYDHLTVMSAPDWFQPLKPVDNGRWFDGQNID